MSRAIDQLALKGRETTGEMPSLGKRRLMLIRVAVVTIPETRKRIILVFKIFCRRETQGSYKKRDGESKSRTIPPVRLKYLL